LFKDIFVLSNFLIQTGSIGLGIVVLITLLGVAVRVFICFKIFCNIFIEIVNIDVFDVSLIVSLLQVVVDVDVQVDVVVVQPEHATADDVTVGVHALYFEGLVGVDVVETQTLDVAALQHDAGVRVQQFLAVCTRIIVHESLFNLVYFLVNPLFTHRIPVVEQ